MCKFSLLDFSISRSSLRSSFEYILILTNVSSSAQNQANAVLPQLFAVLLTAVSRIAKRTQTVNPHPRLQPRVQPALLPRSSPRRQPSPPRPPHPRPPKPPLQLQLHQAHIGNSQCIAKRAARETTTYSKATAPGLTNVSACSRD